MLQVLYGVPCRRPWGHQQTLQMPGVCISDTWRIQSQIQVKWIIWLQSQSHSQMVCRSQIFITGIHSGSWFSCSSSRSSSSMQEPYITFSATISLKCDRYRIVRCWPLIKSSFLLDFSRLQKIHRNHLNFWVGLILPPHGQTNLKQTKHQFLCPAIAFNARFDSSAGQGKVPSTD